LISREKKFEKRKEHAYVYGEHFRNNQANGHVIERERERAKEKNKFSREN
jgi:hypothetical protein